MLTFCFCNLQSNLMCIISFNLYNNSARQFLLVKRHLRKIISLCIDVVFINLSKQPLPPFYIWNYLQWWITTRQKVFRRSHRAGKKIWLFFYHLETIMAHGWHESNGLPASTKDILSMHTSQLGWTPPLPHRLCNTLCCFHMQVNVRERAWLALINSYDIYLYLSMLQIIWWLNLKCVQECPF